MPQFFDRFQPIRRRSLGAQIMLVLGVAMVIILVVFTAGATIFVYRTESASWQGRQNEAAQNAAGAVAAVVQRARDTLTVISIINANILTEHQEELDRLLNQNPTLEEVVRLDAKGHLLVEAHHGHSVLAELITISQSRWFLDAKAGQAYLGTVQLSHDDQPYLLMALPAPDGGVAAAQVRMSVLWGAVADIRFGDNGRAYVITREGDLVAHSDSKMILAGANLSGRPELAAALAAPNAEWHGAYKNFEGAAVVGATASIPGTDWIVVTELAQAEAFAATRTALLVLGGGLLILMALTTWMVARLIERLIVWPMAQLRDGAARIGQGDLHHRIGLARQDEIGQLARAFDDMAEHLHTRDVQVAAQTAALQTSEARYRAIVEDQTELICRFLPDGTLTFVNEAYCRYFGQTREALIGHSFLSFIHEEDRAFVESQVARQGPQTPLVWREERVRLPDGSIRWQHWTDRAILNAAGQVIEYQAVGQDVTEQRLAEAALRASEASLRRITDNMLDVVSQIDTSGVIQYASPSHQWVLGIQPQEVIGQFIFERLHPDDLTEAALTFSEVLNHSDARKKVAFRYRHAAGHYLWMEVVGSLLYDSQGQITGLVISSRDITARKHMEAALRESEKLYRLVAENATDVIWMRDMTLRMTYISPSVTKLRGFSVEEALSQSIAEILTPDSAERAQQFFLEILMLTAQATPEELRSQARALDLEMKRKDGSTVWTESQMSFLLDEQGQPAGILGVTRDITERRRAADELRHLNLELEVRVRERTAELVRVNAELMAEVVERQRVETALRENETRLRRITDNMLDLIVQTDARGVYEYISPSHLPVMGYEACDLVGRPLFEFIHPDDMAQVAEAVQSAFRTPAMIQMEVRCRHADGRYVWLESVSNPLLDETGQLVGAIIGSRDITQRKRAEDLLRQAEAKYRMLVENIPAAVFIWELGEGGACRYISPQIEGMLGFSVEEWQGDPGLWHRQLHPDDHARAIADGNHSLATGEPLHSEYRLLARDGRVVWVRDEAVLFPDEAGQLRLNQGYLLDITKQKQAEAKIQESLREKEVLLKEIHHRVKNNLQIISSLLSLQSDTVTDPETLEVLRDSQNRVRSMALVHEKLYSSSNLARIDFAEYVRSLTTQLSRTYALASARVVLTFAVETIWLDVDTAIPCGLIINELVTNALKHAFPDERAGEIQVGLSRAEDGHIILRVSDTGVGFSDTLDFRNSPSLGLKLVNILSNQIRGEVELRRAPGTEFCIRFKSAIVEMET